MVRNQQSTFVITDQAEIENQILDFYQELFVNKDHEIDIESIDEFFEDEVTLHNKLDQNMVGSA